MAVPKLLHDCWNWALLKQLRHWRLLQQHERNTETVGTKFFWSFAGYRVFDNKTHEIRALNIYYLNEINVNCRCQYTLHLFRMNNTHIPKLVYAHTPTDRISLDGLSSGFSAAAVVVDDYDELGMCI